MLEGGGRPKSGGSSSPRTPSARDSSPPSTIFFKKITNYKYQLEYTSFAIPFEICKIL